ncbi:CEI_1a_G0045390.mRNA.1.CDS.1 [Saccharomyces cerevisiae]|nr:CEI_1a_G0045390.mRNA.1.CDS.1 [Saccharomyces cerevisiae]CAI4737848.1 AMH_1a_G0045500.mRNA.1.CDS.1 [Saccharomyces cerevisiae]CAI6860143.1 AMH_1a_G0045500.mRNA.1.CDS.1 [Saccharomyces cerevisiae]CAI7443673.1 CEI_1a_G0045390.mRNA.1.CDS.1 [Saccharomyces cerevisiae]
MENNKIKGFQPYSEITYFMSKVSITLSTTICQVTLKIMFTESVELVEQVLLVLLYLSSPNKTKV